MHHRPSFHKGAIAAAIVPLITACAPGPESAESGGSAVINSCPTGTIPDCEPEAICFGSPPHCSIKNICTCVESDPFPIAFPVMPSHGGGPLPEG
jgi:hypothetical protein